MIILEGSSRFNFGGKIQKPIFQKVPQKGVGVLDVVDVVVGGDVAGVASEIRPERQLDHD